MEDETVETATDGISLGKKEVLQTEVQHFAARLSRRLWERRHFAEFHSIPYPGGDLWQLGWELGLLCCFSWLDFSRRTLKRKLFSGRPPVPLERLAAGHLALTLIPEQWLIVI